MSTTSSHQSSLEEARTESRKFLLLKDLQARSKRGVNSTSKLKLISRHEEQRVLKGSLWEERESVSPNHSLNSFGSSGSRSTVLSGRSAPAALSLSNSTGSGSNRKLELDSIEYDEVTLQTSESNVSELMEQQCRLLLAIPDCEERYRVYLDKEHMATSTLISVDSQVMVSTRKIESCRGVVRWRGRLPSKQGISFGIEIQDEKAGCGDCDGLPQFKCSPNSGVFVNISNIKLIKPLRPERKIKRNAGRSCLRKPGTFDKPQVNGGSKYSDVSKSSDMSSYEGEESEAEPALYPVMDPQINDRVVWFGESGYERATVKWFGVLPNDDNVQEGETLVGVEFDNPIGKGAGFYQKRRLFHAKKGHASLVPLVGLFKESHNLESADIPRRQHYPIPSPTLPPLQFSGDPILPSEYLTEMTADNILRDLAIDDAESELKIGANHKKDFKKSKNKPGFLFSPKRLFNGGKSSGNASSNDSLEHDNVTTALSSPHRRTPLSPQKRSTKTPTGLLVPEAVHSGKASSVGSISPRSYDGWSQGSDTHSSPSHVNHSPPYCVHSVEPANKSSNNNNANNIINNSPTRRKRLAHSPHKTNKCNQREGGVAVDAFDGSSRVCRVTPSSSLVIEECAVTIDGQPGVIKWIGYDISKPSRYFAGVKMAEPNGSCSCGSYGNERLVHSSENDIMFVNLRKCELLRPEVLCEDGYVSDDTRSQEAGQEADIDERLLQPQALSEAFLGERRGIQGDLNSCYMDASLYAMFAHTTAFDHLLIDPTKCGNVASYSEIQTVLRSRIVNPLRKNGFVAKEAIHHLRKLLDELGIVKGLREEQKDPEEFINLLLLDVFKVAAPIQLSNGQSCHSFHLLSEKDARIAFPTVQELLENSCAQEQLKFKQTPMYLILHMPRFGKDFRMYDKILPSIDLDVTDVVEGAPRCCYMCGESAVWECPECYVAESEWKKSTFCHDCSNTVHKHDKRSGHMPIDLKLFSDAGGNEAECISNRSPALLKLFAVLCIETSHYVTFTRANSTQWLFFDSMADRHGDINVPKVNEVADLTFWLSKEGFANIAKDFDSVPAMIKRLVRDGYICFYCSAEILDAMV